MDYRRMGTSGLKVSEIGLGCNNFGMRIDQAATTAVVNAALEAGITLFDTADIYGGTQSEVMLGVALGDRRKDIVLATKFAGPLGAGANDRGGSRRYVIRACEASLKRLGTDHIDLYQMHFPDAETPIEETLRALDDLVTSGKVRYIGCSNFSGWQIADADWIARTQGLNRFVSAQNNFSLLERNLEREVVPAAERFGLGILPYFPLASGLLSGKMSKTTQFTAQDHRSYNRDGQAFYVGETFSGLPFDKGVQFADEIKAWLPKGMSLPHLALRWILDQKAVSTIIAGVTKPSQLTDNVAAGRMDPLEPKLVEKLKDFYIEKVRPAVRGGI